MPTNSQILIDGFISDEFSKQTEYSSKGDYFELLASSRYMAPYDLDDDEIAEGLIGGSRDGGCDAIYIFANNYFLSEDVQIQNYINRGSRVEIVILQTKVSKSFKEDAFLKWKDTCNDLLTFDKNLNDFDDKYSDRVIDTFGRIREAIQAAAMAGNEIRMKFVYIANADSPSDGVKIQKEQLPAAIDEIVGVSRFSSSCVLVGADELMRIWSPPAESGLVMRFSGSYASVPQRTDVFGLVSLSDYYRFLTDDQGQLRSYLFEANVRDYEGNVSVNKGIRETLEHPSEDDFWWLNNGVTILASEAYQIAGAEVKMEEPRIVNGLQTSYEIYKFMESRTEDAEDSRNVMVKILVPGSDETRNRVILATNNQTQVKKTSLRATDQIHIQIELYMKRNGLYYERRKNYYKNQGRKREEIVTLSFLAQCMMSILLGRPDQARARPSTLLSDEVQYKKIFGQDGNLEAYYRAASLGKQVCLKFPQIKRDLEGSQISDIRFYVIMGVASMLSNKDSLTFGDIENLDLDKLSDEIIQTVADMVMDVIWPLAEHPKLLSLTPWQVRSRKRFHYCCLRAIQGCSLECHQQRGPFCKGPLYFRSAPNSLTITNQLASSTASLSAPTLMQA